VNELILLVDDESSIIQHLSLERQGLHIISDNDGEAALATVASVTGVGYKLVITSGGESKSIFA
jgi:CheY-like chemotaxis protein